MRERKLIGLHAMCEHIERRKTRATTISHGVFAKDCHNWKKKLYRSESPIFPTVLRLGTEV